MRKIDVFNHIFPRRDVERMTELAGTMKDVGKRVRGVPMLVDLDVRFQIMDEHPEYQQILSIATPPVDAFASPGDAADLAQRAPARHLWRSIHDQALFVLQPYADRAVGAEAGAARALLRQLKALAG